jgi:alkylhydroperoxidase family enzyme
MATVRPWTDDEAENGCSYCIHSHTAAAKQKGMTDAQHMQILAIIGMASETNALVNAMQVPIDREFLVGE